jgi:membrane protease YdiL (CAAX protease family)
MKGEINELELDEIFYSEIKNPHEELDNLKRSLDAYSKFTYLPYLAAKILLKLGKTYCELDEYQDALESYLIALELFKDENSLEGEGYVLMSLGKLSMKYNRYADSRKYFKNAMDIAQKLNNSEMENEISKSIASSYMDEGYLDDALREYKKLNQSQYNDNEGGDSNDPQIVKIKKQLSLLRPSRGQAYLLIFYLIFLLVSELITTYGNFEVGLLAHVILIVLIIINSALTDSVSFSNLLRAMIILPIIRIIGISIPALQIQPLFWYILVSIPIFAAALIMIKNQSLSRESIGLILGKLPLQFLVALSGIIFGFVEFQILKPASIISSPSVVTIILASVILLISTGFAEELIFRGIIQKNAENVLGNIWGLIYASVLFTVLYIGWQSNVEIIFIFFVSIFYGYIFQRTRSIFGISLSHGIANIMLLLVLPLLI